MVRLKKNNIYLTFCNKFENKSQAMPAYCLFSVGICCNQELPNVYLHIDFYFSLESPVEY